ncbi:hypothetical protein BY996DRAFT_6415155 [Phakopsora pachyrhizi]|uniref:Expressed protein n=1 Tax=Phakopsora pachyrhizi TaxID=170000 RepID=A0AAV0AFC9_PHAPC|nr:hypothetical protein BY996DRAFT_6415155 [Phakopsora pachyrhizi]CAH7666818.1 expressed protein [Phakopsora pachyrhizi]
MTKISANKIFKIVNLLMFIFLVFLCVDCFGSFLLLKSSFESREKKLELPIQSQLNGLDHSDSFKLSLGSRCSSTPGKPSRDEFPKTLKFDLNELPEENDSYLGNGLFENENEEDSHQVSKKRRIEIIHDPTNQGLIEHPTPNLNTFGRLNRGSALLSNNFIHDSGFGPSQIPTTNINTVNSFGHRLLSKDQHSSSKSVPIRIINLPRFKTVSSTKINQPKKRMKNDIASWKKPKTLVNWEPRINFQRLVETYDSKEEKTYQSPYNRNLLNFLKKNLNQIMPEELENFQFTSDFLEGIERFYWNNELNTFVLVEETIPMVMFFCDSWSHKKKGSTWVKYSSKGLETRHLQDAPASFKFKSVFTNVYRLEKLGDSFYNEKMRLKSVDYLRELEGTLSMIKRDMNKSMNRYSHIIDRIFSSLPGYLVLVHGINEIIRPRSLMHKRPVSQQEQALDFFIELHSELADSYRISQQGKVNVVMSDVRWANLKFNERKRHLAYKIVNSNHIYGDHLAWVYVELWLITHRLNFYKCTDLATAEKDKKISKFKSSLNKLLFLLFSGIVKLK